MKTFKFYLAVIISVVSLIIASSCKTIQTVAPPESYESPKIELKPSIVTVPIEINIKDLESRLNKELKGTLYEDNSFDGDDLKVKAIKKDNFTIGLNGTELTYRIPLRLQIQVKKMFVVLPEITAELALKFKTTISLNKDWTLTTKTTSAGFEWPEYTQHECGRL